MISVIKTKKEEKCKKTVKKRDEIMKNNCKFIEKVRAI